MKVAKLTTEQKNKLVGKEVEKGVKFLPVQDKNNNWIISLQEVEQTDIEWVKDLPLIDFEPKVVSLI